MFLCGGGGRHHKPRKTLINWNDALTWSSAGMWIQRTLCVPSKRRAVIQAVLGLAITAVSLYAIQLSRAAPTEPRLKYPLWVSPGVTYASLLCIRGDEEPDYTCQKTSLRG
jgi:hypothetical protein